MKKIFVTICTFVLLLSFSFSSIVEAKTAKIHNINHYVVFHHQIGSKMIKRVKRNHKQHIIHHQKTLRHKSKSNKTK